MKIRTKLIGYFLAVVLLPCGLFTALFLERERWVGYLPIIFAFSMLIALGVAWLLSRSLSLPLYELARYLEAVASGRLDEPLSERTYRGAKEYADLATTLTMTMTTLSGLQTELAAQVGDRTQALDLATRNLATARGEVDRLNNVMIDRELKMIEIKTRLRDTLARLGEEVRGAGLRDADMETYSFNSEQGKAAILNLLEDLQDEKRLLATEKAKDDAILRSIGDGIAVADVRGVVTYLNGNARAMLGLPTDDSGGAHLTELPGIFDPKTNAPLALVDLPLFKATKGRAVEKQLLLVRGERVPEGRYISMTATPIIVASVPIGAVATFRDITKEQEVDRAKTEFVSLASHQLRTPLSTINWYAEMLLAGDAGELNDEQRKYLDQVYQGNQRMVELINSLLNVSRLELGTFAIDPEDTDVITLAQSVLDEQMPQIKERTITLSAELDRHTPHLYADPKLLRMVFQNLVSNAVKYTPIGGAVTVRVAPQAENIAITVADTGLGIPLAEQSRIFSKLFRATNARESDTDGTGLGLYIVKSVVEQAGGTIRFDSEEGKGTTFHILLPKSGMHKKEGTKRLS